MINLYSFFNSKWMQVTSLLLLVFVLFSLNYHPEKQKEVIIARSAECNVQMINSQQFISIPDSDYKIYFSAKKRCSTKVGLLADLKDINFELFLNNKSISKIKFKSGFWSEIKQVLVLSQITMSSGCIINNPPLLQIDLNKKIIRGSFGNYIPLQRGKKRKRCNGFS